MWMTCVSSGITCLFGWQCSGDGGEEEEKERTLNECGGGDNANQRQYLKHDSCLMVVVGNTYILAIQLLFGQLTRVWAKLSAQ